MLEAQKALHAEDFPPSADCECGNEYAGAAIDKTARVLAIGHGSQVLLTAEAAALVGGALPVLRSTPPATFTERLVTAEAPAWAARSN